MKISFSVWKTMAMYTNEREFYWTFETNEQTGRVSISAAASAYIHTMSIYDGDMQEHLREGTTVVVPQEYEQTFDTLSTTSFVVEKVGSSQKYIYNVWARLHEEISLISNKIVVETISPSGVGYTTQSEKEVRIVNGALHFTASAGELYHIYTMDGTNYCSSRAQEGDNKVVLPEGLYILSIGTDHRKYTLPNRIGLKIEPLLLDFYILMCYLCQCNHTVDSVHLHRKEGAAASSFLFE